MAKKTKKKLVLIADSACDLPVEIIEQYSIVILPISIYFPDETRTQYVDITTEEFFKKLEEIEELPTTGVPPPRVYKQTFDKALEISDEGIMLDLSGDLSGIYNYGVIYSKQFTENKITVVDSRTATLPFGLLVLKTARMIEEGLTKEEILKKLKKIIPKVQLTAFLGTLKYLKRSGRISSVKHILGNLMQFKPLITIRNGVIDSPSRVRGDSASMEYLKNLGEKLTKSLPKNETIVVLHSQNFEKAEELVQHIENSTKKKFEVLTWEIGPAIGVHVGPGALGLTWVGKPFEELLK
jgi:DegV family protein with EDD domain